MGDELELEAGKTYVFKDEAAKGSYCNCNRVNAKYFDTFYKEGFTLEHVDSDGDGWVGHKVVIVQFSEGKYFKLKEENVNTFTKDMLKYGMVVMLRKQEGKHPKGRLLVTKEMLVGKEGHLCLESYTNDLLMDDLNSDFDIMQVFSVDDLAPDLDNWTLNLLWERKEEEEEEAPELSPNQNKIEEIQSTINKLQRQVDELKGE